MALVFADLVRESTSTTGTGTLTLTGAVTNYQSFAAIGNANTTYYRIISGTSSEVGIGTYTLSGTTLSRDTVLYSTAGGVTKITVASGATVICTYPAEKVVILDGSGNATALGTPAAFVGTNITGTASSFTAGQVTTNANLTGAVTSVGNATSLGSFTSLQLATALTNETGTGPAVFSDNASLLNPTYTGTLTGSTGILNIGSGQVYKDASGNVGFGTATPAYKLDVSGTLGVTGAVTLSTALPVASGGTGLTSIAHTVQVFTSGSGTYTTPANVKAIWVRAVGGGGGAGGSGSAGSPANGTGGGSTTFSTLTASAGGGGPNSLTGGFQGGAGGTPTGGDINARGGSGQTNPGNTNPALYQGYGGNGGVSAFGGSGIGGVNGAGGTGGAGVSGGGGGGVGGNSATYASAGAGAGGYCEKLIAAPSATYSYAVGAGGAGGAAGTGGGTGGAGGAGLIIVTEYYV